MAISVSQPANAGVPEEAADVQGSDVDTTAGTTEPVEIKPAATTFNVDFAVQGDYGR